MRYLPSGPNGPFYQYGDHLEFYCFKKLLWDAQRGKYILICPWTYHNVLQNSRNQNGHHDGDYGEKRSIFWLKLWQHHLSGLILQKIRASDKASDWLIANLGLQKSSHCCIKKHLMVIILIKLFNTYSYHFCTIHFWFIHFFNHHFYSFQEPPWGLVKQNQKASITDPDHESRGSLSRAINFDLLKGWLNHATGLLISSNSEHLRKQKAETVLYKKKQQKKPRTSEFQKSKEYVTVTIMVHRKDFSFAIKLNQNTKNCLFKKEFLMCLLLYKITLICNKAIKFWQ